MDASTIRTTAALTGLAAAAALPVSAEMSSNDDGQTTDWRTMTQEVMPASDLVEANVSNGLNPIGEVSHVILDHDLEQVEYLVYQANRRPWYFTVRDGFVTFEAADYLNQGFGDLTVRVEDPDDMAAPKEIDINNEEADYRLVSRIVDASLHLPGDRSYQIEDMLVNRDSGKITHFVIASEEDALFPESRRAVPASKVKFHDDAFRTELTFAEIDSRQPYDPSLL